MKFQKAPDSPSRSRRKDSKNRCKLKCRKCGTVREGHALTVLASKQWTIVYCRSDHCCRETVHDKVA